MRQALLAAEDAKFYQHGAVDFSGLARATFANVVTGSLGRAAARSRCRSRATSI